MTPGQKKKALEAILELGTVHAASLASGLSRAEVLGIKTSDPEGWEAALGGHRDRLYGAAYRRAIVGWDEDVYYQGEVVGSKRVHSEKMLEFLIRRHDGTDPEEIPEGASVQLVHYTGEEE